MEAKNGKQLLKVPSMGQFGQLSQSKSDPLIYTSCKIIVEDTESNDLESVVLTPYGLSPATSHESIVSSEGILTIEELKIFLSSCLACGVNWCKNEFTMDCHECGGYAMTRPCPHCNGKCESQWKRDVAASHDLRRAVWTGECKLSNGLVDLLKKRFVKCF